MINKRFIWHLEIFNLITKEQCGFQKNHSTIDILATLHTDICNAKNIKQHLIIISLNIKKAYDMIWRNRVLKIIQNNGINVNMFLFLQNFLKNCKYKLEHFQNYQKYIILKMASHKVWLSVLQCFYWPSTKFSKTYQNPQNIYYSLTTVTFIATDKTPKHLLKYYKIH
jgi:hypothetical protein